MFNFKISIWSHILDHLSGGKKMALLYVVQSEGSSPGRQGFLMVVDQEGEMSGSIGGGIMEQKLVELAKSKLKSGTLKPFIKRQVHQKEADASQSGMICSGEQTIAFYTLDPSHLDIIENVHLCYDGKRLGVLELSDTGISFHDNLSLDDSPSFSQTGDSWIYRQQMGYSRRIFILGGGHVGLALSTVMRHIGFYVEIFDDRTGLNTMEQNEAAHKKHYIEYPEVARHIPEGDNVYVAIVSFGYRTDKEVLKRLIGRKYKYLGMMGSKEKVKEIFDDLIREGMDAGLLQQVHAPIGLPINSKTPEEIAVSIAAEIIQLTYSS